MLFGKGCKGEFRPPCPCPCPIARNPWDTLLTLSIPSGKGKGTRRGLAPSSRRAASPPAAPVGYNAEGAPSKGELFIAFGGRKLESVSVSGTVSVSGRATMPDPANAGTPSAL
jgi:hypothetical protein